MATADVPRNVSVWPRWTTIRIVVEGLVSLLTRVRGLTCTARHTRRRVARADAHIRGAARQDRPVARRSGPGPLRTSTGGTAPDPADGIAELVAGGIAVVVLTSRCVRPIPIRRAMKAGAAA
jgi:hypothetical protein